MASAVEVATAVLVRWQGGDAPDLAREIVAALEQAGLLNAGWRAFVREVACLFDSTEHTPSDPDDATATLDALIAKAREIMPDWRAPAPPPETSA